MGNIIIRKVNFSDVEILKNISIQSFKETFADVNTEEDMLKYVNENLSIEQLLSELKNPNSEFYLAEKKQQALGYLKLNFGDSQTENQGNDALEIERIYVLKEFFDLKIGQLLFEKALEVTKERKVNFIWLGVWEENHRAIRFYEKNGFVIFGKHDFVLGDDVQTDLMMKLTLK